MKKSLSSILLVCVMLFHTTFSVSATYEMSKPQLRQIIIPDYPFIINGYQTDFKNSIYPIVSYDNITYFPMTWHYCRMLGLASEWNENTGLSITKQEHEFEIPLYETVSNKGELYASIADYNIYVNGKKVDNSNAKYPVLNFRYVTYFPITWEFVVDTFGWEYSFDNTKGLAVNSNTYKNRLDKFRVIGYYSGDLFDEPTENLRADKLTHIMYAFLIPDESGTCLPFSNHEKVKSIISHAHQNNCKVYVAVGGWSHNNIPLAPTFEVIASDSNLRQTFVKNIMNVVEEYGFDGVELDWEYPTEQSCEHYEALVQELSGELKKRGKGLTAALNGAWSATEGPKASEYVTQNCLEEFEFISVMSYDMNNEQHSPFHFAKTSIEYWKNRGVPQDKIVLGMPLYARPTWMQYRHIVEKNPEAAFVDSITIDGVTSHYNGLVTLRKKTILAAKKAGGVMLFDVNEDTNDSYSVVLMIDNVISQLKQNGLTSDDTMEFSDNTDISK